MDDYEERLRRIEEKLDRLMEREASADEGQQDSAEREGWPGEAGVTGLRSADLALSVRSGQNGDDGMFVCLEEIGNYGEGAANRVRWWLSTEDGDVVSTVAGGDDVQLGSRETVELEVVEVPGWEKFPLQKVWCRLAWHDAEGDHEKQRPYVESAKGMWKWRRKRPIQ